MTTAKMPGCRKSMRGCASAGATLDGFEKHGLLRRQPGRARTPRSARPAGATTRAALTQLTDQNPCVEGLVLIGPKFSEGRRTSWILDPRAGRAERPGIKEVRKRSHRHVPAEGTTTSPGAFGP